MRRATINDIAKAAGVSKTAVSFAFNAPEQLAPATVMHIRAVAERLGYSPDPIARSMTTRKTNAIGLLLPHDIAHSMQNPFFARFIEGVGVVCKSADKHLTLVSPVGGSRRQAIPHVAVDGFLVIGIEKERGEVQALRQRHVPFVIVDSQAPEDVPNVNVDDRSGAYAIMRYVLERGHRCIGVVALSSGKQYHSDYTGTLAARMQGYQQAFDEYGVALDGPDVQLVEAPASFEGGYRAFARLWAGEPRPTAIVTMSDVIAFGILNAAREHGVHVPGELSLAGFDDLLESRVVDPPLTTVHQPIEEKGRVAATLLIDAISGTSAPVHRVLATELVVRSSVAAPRPIFVDI